MVNVQLPADVGCLRGVGAPKGLRVIARAAPAAALSISLLAWPTPATAAQEVHCQGDAPRPTGAYAVAEHRVDLVDPQRTDRLEPTRQRRFPVSFFYPVEGERVQAPYASGPTRQVVLSAWPLAPAALTHRCLWLGAPGAGKATGVFPTIIFTHGLSWPAEVYRSMLIDLASHGYVVAAITHTHAASLTSFASGETVDMSRWPRIEDEAERETYLASYLGEWIADIRFLGGLLERSSWLTTLPFGGNVDLSPGIGIFGHSYGGSAAAQVIDGRRFRAAFAMEARYRGPDVEGGYRPGGALAHVIGSYNRLELEGSQYAPGAWPLYELLIEGAWHASFSDLVMLYRTGADPEWIERHWNELPPERTLQIVGTLAVTFFDAWLKGRDSPYLHPVSYGRAVDSPRTGGFPEVELRIDVSPLAWRDP